MKKPPANWPAADLDLSEGNRAELADAVVGTDLDVDAFWRCSSGCPGWWRVAHRVRLSPRRREWLPATKAGLGFYLGL